MHACVYICIGFPGGSVTKNQPANTGDMGWTLGPEDPLEKEMATLSSTLSTKAFTHTHIMYVVVVLVTKSCLTLCHYMDYSPPFSSVHGIIQARILEWVAISFSRGSS